MPSSFGPLGFRLGLICGFALRVTLARSRRPTLARARGLRLRLQRRLGLGLSFRPSKGPRVATRMSAMTSSDPGTLRPASTADSGARSDSAVGSAAMRVGDGGGGGAGLVVGLRVSFRVRRLLGRTFGRDGPGG